MHPLKLVRTVITSSEKVMILNAMWKQYMTGSKRWHLKLALEHLWDRKKWKFQNSFSAVNVLKHSTHLQTWKGTCDASKRQQLNWCGRYHTEKTVWFVCVELLFLMPCLLRCNWLIEFMKSKLVYISLSPPVELCKKKHSFKKQNFKENRQFDTWNVWHGRLIIFKCQIVTFLKVEARDSVYPRSLLVSKLWEL